jgi:hypothetical protein
MKAIITLVLTLLIVASYFYIERRLEAAEQEVPDVALQITPAEIRLSSLGNVSSYSSISDRPLFVETRKFEVEKKPEVKVKKAPVRRTLKVQALGVAVSNEGILAVVKSQTSGKIFRLNVGDEIDGWTLQSVANQRFTFTRDNVNKVVTFKK